MSVTHQRTGQPEVTDLGAFAHAAEESAHTLTAAAGATFQVGSDGHLVVLTVKRAREGRFVTGTADQGIAVSAVSSIVNIVCQLGAASVVTGVHSLGVCIELLSCADGIYTILVSIGEVTAMLIDDIVTFEGQGILVESDALEEDTAFALTAVHQIGQLTAGHLFLGHNGLGPDILGIIVVHEVVLVVFPLLGPLRRQLIVAVLGNHQLLVVTRHRAVLLLAAGVLRLEC